MGKFSKNGGREMPELNTSSLPDLIFAFLFFIMMVTSIREVTAKVEYSNLPRATELTKLEEVSPLQPIAQSSVITLASKSTTRLSRIRSLFMTL